MDFTKTDDPEPFVTSFWSTSLDAGLFDIAYDFTDAEYSNWITSPSGILANFDVGRSDQNNFGTDSPQQHQFRSFSDSPLTLPRYSTMSGQPFFPIAPSSSINPNYPFSHVTSQSVSHFQSSVESNMERTSQMKLSLENSNLVMPKQEIYTSPVNTSSVFPEERTLKRAIKSSSQKFHIIPDTKLNAIVHSQGNATQTNNTNLNSSFLNSDVQSLDFHPSMNDGGPFAFRLANEIEFDDDSEDNDVEMGIRNGNAFEVSENARHSESQQYENAFPPSVGTSANSTPTNNNAVTLFVDTQPPVEVRTRTPSEKRYFSCSIVIDGDAQKIGAKYLAVELIYASDRNKVPKQTILGGTKMMKIKKNQKMVFDNLSMSEASTRHGEKEFCLRFSLLNAKGQRIPGIEVVTTPFYAYSNSKVLARRRNIQLRALSPTSGSITGGELMHVIGTSISYSPKTNTTTKTKIENYEFSKF
jgi:hypothetical protein